MKHIINKLKLDSSKNKNAIDNKDVDYILFKSSNEFHTRSKLTYDSDWEVCVLENYAEATSLTEGTLLPQKATFDFEFTLDMPESFLPHIRWNVLAKTVPEQVVKGVGEFVFTSLREIVMSVWQWQGITQLIGTAGDVSDLLANGATAPNPTLPPYVLTKPTPQSAYSQSHEYTKVYFPAGSGQTWDTNEDGTILDPGQASETLLADFLVQYRINWHIPDLTMVGCTWTIRETVDFIPDTWFYKPFNDDSIDPDFPNGTTDTDRDGGTQYWEQEQLYTFNEFMVNDGVTWGYPGVGTIEDKYDYVVDIFEEYYPAEKSLITSYPATTYHAYRPVEENVVVSGIQQELISCLDITHKNSFKYRIKGYMLLLSEANTLTSYSDLDNPTYEPNGEDLFVRLKVYYDSKLNTKSITQYNS